SLRNRSNPEDRALLDQLKNVTSKLANLVLNGPGKSSLAEQQQQIKSLSEQRDSLEIEIGRRSAGYYQSSAAVTLRAIRDAVPPEAALVEYAIYQPYDPRSAIESINKAEPRYVAYVITHGGGVQVRDLGETREIDRAVGALRRSLRNPEARDVKKLS